MSIIIFPCTYIFFYFHCNTINVVDMLNYIEFEVFEMLSFKFQGYSICSFFIYIPLKLFIYSVRRIIYSMAIEKSKKFKLFIPYLGTLYKKIRYVI
jgi:hypothetical protein